MKNETKFWVLYFFGTFICFRAPIVRKFYLCGKKKTERPTDKQTNNEKEKKNKKKKISWIRGFIQFLFIPNIAQFSFVLNVATKKMDRCVLRLLNFSFNLL